MILPQGIFTLYNSTTSDMITSNFGVRCKIIYASNKLECINCILNPISKSSSGRYKSGGPIAFSGIICPYCSGDGYTLISTSDTIRMRVYYSKKDFIKVDVPLAIKNSDAQSIGFLTDIPKFQNMIEMVANIDIQGYGAMRYELAGEPLPHGLGQDKKYFIAFWNRIQ